MSDIQVSDFHWAKLKKSKNAFLPKLIETLAPMTAAPSNKDIAEAARRAGVEDISQHRVGDVMNLKPIRAGTVEHVLAGYRQLVSEREDLPALDEQHIVVGALVIPKLEQLVGFAALEVEHLADLSGVSVQAINHALGGGRVSGGIACALWTTLGAKLADGLPPLGKFAEANVKHGRKSIELVDQECPLTYSDLLLPLLPDHPRPWP